jgi:hypothetical protein
MPASSQSWKTRKASPSASAAGAAEILQGDWTQLLAAHDANRIAITPETAVTRWRGEHMDYGTAVDAMLYRTRHAETDTLGTGRFRGNA